MVLMPDCGGSFFMGGLLEKVWKSLSFIINSPHPASNVGLGEWGPTCYNANFREFGWDAWRLPSFRKKDRRIPMIHHKEALHAFC